MRRDLYLAVAATIACLLPGQIAAQDNPLLGVWAHDEPATQSTPLSRVEITFASDGTWVNRYSWGTSPITGTGSGMAITRGEYHLTGSTSYAARAATMDVCPYIPTPAEMAEVARRAVLGEGPPDFPPCGPASQTIRDSIWPNFGRLTQTEFNMITPASMSLSSEGQPAVLFVRIR